MAIDSSTSTAFSRGFTRRPALHTIPQTSRIEANRKKTISMRISRRANDMATSIGMERRTTQDVP